MKKFIVALKKEKRGFTLVELLVVLVILALLAAAIIPSVLGFIDEANRKLCEVNRLQIIRYYHILQQTRGAMGETITLADTFAGKYPEVAADIPRILCPVKGTYTVEGDLLRCSHSNHGSNNGTPPAPPPAADKYPGTEIPLVPSYWPKDSDYLNPWDTVSVSPGSIFLHTDGQYYVITKSISLTKDQAQSGPGGTTFSWMNTQKITGKRWTMADYNSAGQIVGVTRGDLLEDGDGGYYVFTDGGSHGNALTGGQWYKLP